MTAIEHEREFAAPEDPKRVTAQKRVAEETSNLAGAYARVFSGDDGERVLADLRLKFGPRRQRFGSTISGRSSDPIQAAIIDGQCDAMREIEDAIERGTPARFTTTKP